MAANENRYEGQWKDDKKHGKGKFFYLDRGQMYTGVWCDDIPKCGTVEDFGRHEAPKPTTYPLPEVGAITLHDKFKLQLFLWLIEKEQYE